MKYIEAVFNQNYISVILAVFLLLFAIKEIIDLISYFKKKGRIKTGSEQDKENVENRLITLEKHDNWQYKEISKISQGIDDIKKRMDLNEEETRQRIVVQFGAEIYNLHNKFMSQGYVTRAGLETFNLLADIYLKANGNHSIKGKIIPEVMELEIKDE